MKGGCLRSALRRHGPKGVSTGAAGSQQLQKPALEAQGNPKLQLLGWPLNKRPYTPPSHPFPLKLVSLTSPIPNSPLHPYLTSVPTNFKTRIFFWNAASQTADGGRSPEPIRSSRHPSRCQIGLPTIKGVLNAHDKYECDWIDPSTSTASISSNVLSLLN